MRPGPLPDHGQPPDPSLASLAVLAVGMAVMAAITLSPGLRERLSQLRPLPWHRRLRAQFTHRLRAIR